MRTILACDHRGMLNPHQADSTRLFQPSEQGIRGDSCSSPLFPLGYIDHERNRTIVD